MSAIITQMKWKTHAASDFVPFFFSAIKAAERQTETVPKENHTTAGEGATSGKAAA